MTRFRVLLPLRVTNLLTGEVYEQGDEFEIDATEEELRAVAVDPLLAVVEP